MSDAIERVGVIGAGQMGAGIAEVSARAGVDVLVFETTQALITAGRARIVKSLERGVSAGKITERERDAAVGRLKFTTNLADVADRQLVIEAIIDERGNVTEARAISGQPLLVAAALKAVSQRRYEPTILDGEPTPIELTVEVTFHG